MCALFARIAWTTKRLADSGMSQRQIAKRAGVSQMQVRRDLKRNGSKTETKRLTKAERRAAREAELAAKVIALRPQSRNAARSWLRSKWFTSRSKCCATTRRRWT